MTGLVLDPTYNTAMQGGNLSNLIQFLAVAAIPMLFAITVHEVAHGWMARRFGDRTAELLGRLTLNPIKHIDPIGTVVVPLLMALYTGFIFGWAKPVPVNPNNLRNPKQNMIAVAAAGPGANVLMAVGWLVVFYVSAAIPAGPLSQFLAYMSGIGVFFNILLAIFNLIPVPPLDGSRVLRGLVSDSLGRRIDTLERYGLIIVVGLLALGLLNPIVASIKTLTRALGIPFF